MSIESRFESAQPRQVILWRSRSHGTVRVSSSAHLADDATSESLGSDSAGAAAEFSESFPRGLVVGRSLPLEVEPPLLDTEPALETCSYCFQVLPQESSGNTGRRRSFGSAWTAQSPQQAELMQAYPNSREWEESRLLAIDPLRKQRPTQMLLTRPYFRMLEQTITNTTDERSAGPSTIHSTRQSSRRSSLDLDTSAANQQDEGYGDAAMEGYYKRFFVEEKRLGMGAQGTVYLCRHVVNGNFLSYHAVKKIAVGNSKEYLADMLREVRLLENIRHKNIIPYETIWIEPASFSRLAPPIEALHILMMYANLGNIDTYITARYSVPADGELFDTSGALDSEAEPLSVDEKKKIFRKRRLSSRSGNTSFNHRQDVRGVMLFNREEVQSLFGDILDGLEFLHSKGIVHLDLKCQNVLLHLFEGDLIPTCLISDFGSSRAVYQYSNHTRTGQTGTMEYLAPETITPNAKGGFVEMDSKLDIWGLGLILHKILFFNLPYGDTSTYDELSDKIKRYPGFKATPDISRACQRRGIPLDMLDILESLLHVDPACRPSASKIVAIWQSIREIQNGPSVPLTVDLVRRTRDAAGHGKDGMTVSSGTSVQQVSAVAISPGMDATGRAVTGWEKCLKYIIAAAKITTAAPPVQARPLEQARFYLIVLLALADLAQNDSRISVLLGSVHLVLVAWRTSL